MNPYLQSVVLGIVEGLTEFLPVSSTAHLRIAESLLHIDLSDGYWKMYTIVIQLGAILTLPIYFRQRIAKFLSTFPQGERGDRTILTHPLSLVLLAFVTTAIPAFLLTKIIGKHLESLIIIGTSLLVGGILMWFIDARNSKAESAGEQNKSGLIHTWHMEDMSIGQAIWIGACQILSALFPGTSRSMSTIAAGQLAGMSRASALEFSFFLSIPTNGRRHRLRPPQIPRRQTRQSHRRLPHRFPRLDRPRHRLRRPPSSSPTAPSPGSWPTSAAAASAPLPSTASSSAILVLFFAGN